MRKILSILTVLLICGSTFASVRKAELDSLIKAGLELTAGGKFELSNKVYEKLLSEYKLIGKLKKYAYGRLAVNADLDGDNVAYYNYLLKSGMRPSDNVAIRQMAALPAQCLDRDEGDVELGYEVDSLYYEGKFTGCEIRVPVTIGGKEEKLILDNGCAKYCVTTESFAREHGIRNIDASGVAVGVVDKVSMTFGVADSLVIGGMKFRNIIFVVLPDAAVDNSVLFVNAMLGGSIFRLAGEMRFDNSARKIVFPSIQDERESNVSIDDGGVHYVQAIADGDTLKMQLDLGATKTALSAAYFSKHAAKVKEKWTEGTTHIGGVGGLETKLAVYALPELTFKACGGAFVRTDVKVSTEKKPNEEDEDGAIGNDFLLSFEKASLNLKKMWFWVQ